MVDVNKASAILNELEAEYLRLGSTLCHNLTDETQLSAFLLLGLRSIALLKSMLVLIQPSTVMAGCDAVERAFLETSQLQFEFRFLDAPKKINDWFARNWNTWKSDKEKLNSFMQAPKGTAFRREYSDYSEAAHPTVDACRSSVALITAVRGMNVNANLMTHTIEVRSSNYANLIFREIWTAFTKEPRLIEIPIDRGNLPLCEAFVNDFIRVLEEQQKAAPVGQP